MGDKDRRIPASQGKGWGHSACEMQKLLCPCPSHLRSPRKSLLNQKAPVSYTTPHEVCLVSQQLDTKLLTAFLALVALSNALAELDHDIYCHLDLECSFLSWDQEEVLATS